MNRLFPSLRILALVALAWMVALEGDAQLLISTGGTVTGCDDALTDAGGPAGPYGANEDFTITLCPEAPDTTIWLEWTIFDLDANATITIYDGDSDAADVLAQGSNSQLDGAIVVASEDNPTGCLTINFVSGANSEGNFVAGINCGQPCANPVPVVNADESNPFQTCPGQEVVYDGTDSYETGDSPIVLWQWDWDGDGVVDEETTEGEAPHVYDEPGIYRLQLHVKDGNDCESTALTNYIVQVSTDPVWTTNPLQYTACTNAPVEITMGIEGVNYTLEPEIDFGGGLFIPDEPGQCFTSELTFNSFIPGQTIEDAEEALENFYLNFEHSYMGDLTITFICPSGQSVMVHQQGGGGTFLGVPVDNDGDPNTPGEGFDYYWEPDATNGTWVDNQGGTLPAGSYESVQTFSNLDGCPLNGVWQMEICDFFGSDNGFVFDWAIEFADTLYPEEQSFTPQFSLDCDSAFWTYDFGSGLETTPCPTLQVSNGAPGPQTVTAHAINDFGCEYTQDVDVKFVTFSGGIVASPQRYCSGIPVQLLANVDFSDAGNAAGTSYSWEYPDQAFVLSAGPDSVSIQVGGLSEPETFGVTISQAFDFIDFPDVTCSETFRVEIETCEIVIPNVMTPFGSVAVNDKFRVDGIDAYEDVQLQIKNRWGATVFSDDNFETSEGWDPVADDASPGVYYYILTIPVDEGPLVVTDINGQEQEYTGEGPFVFQGELHLLR